MGCFLGCFGGAKENKRRKHRINRASPQRQKNRVQNVQQESAITEEQPVIETLTPTPTPTPPSTDLVSELRCKPEEVEQLSPSPKKRVTFNSNITTYEHVSVHESIESLPEINEEKQGDLNTLGHSHSISEDDNSVTSSVGSYPPNHRYHNARESDDEGEVYGDSDLDNLDDEDEDDYSDDDDDIDARISSQQVWTESVLTESMESRTGNPSPPGITQEVESHEVIAFGSKCNARDRSGYVNSVLNPVENVTQWKAAKSKGTHLSKPPQKENFEAPRISFSSEPMLGEAPFSFKTKSKNANQEIAVDASLSNWLLSPEIKKTSSEGCTPVRSFEDRPILGALTVEELRQISASNASPRKSPSRSPDEMPIIGSVGTYWNHLSSTKHSNSASSFKGIPNTTSKYREDKRVNWHSTPFETRLDRALDRGDC
ncbi:hypothetical protein ACS0TY_007313 [Phlomoides rotata]